MQPQLANFQRSVDYYFDRITARKRLIGLAVVYSVVVGLGAIYLDLYYAPNSVEYTLDINIGLFFVGVIFAIIPSIWIPKTLFQPHSLLYWGVYLLVYVPSVLITPLRAGSGSIAFVFLLACCMALLAIPSYVSPLPLPELNISERTFWAGMIVAFGGFLTFAVVMIDIPLNSFTSTAIYDVRHEYKDSLGTLGPLASRFTVYAVDWLYLALSPLFFAVGCLQYSWWKIGIGIFGFLTVFLITGFKTALFIPVIIVALGLILTYDWDHFASYALLGMSAALFGAGALHRVTGIISPASFLRRLLLLPGHLTSMYYEFFLSNPKTYFSGRFFGELFINYPYDMPIPNVIGAVYFDRPVQSANANFWAEGFATLGYPGLILFTVILVVGFWLYDSAAGTFSPRMRTLILTGYIITIANSDTISLFATNGFAFFLLIVYFYSQAKNPVTDTQ